MKRSNLSAHRWSFYCQHAANRRITNGTTGPTGHLGWATQASRGARFAPRAKIFGGLSQGLLSAAAAILAYLPTKPLGLQEGFWGSITAIAVVQSEVGATRNSGREQFVGAAIGGLTSAVIVSLFGHSLVANALAVVVSVMACWVLNVGSAARLAGSTATIIALVPHHGKVEWMVMSRITEVVWGVAVGIGIVWLVNRFETLSAERESFHQRCGSVTE
jgi:uncharacterized membrane protein YccC